MPTYRVILAVVFSSFLALSAVSCDRDKPPEKTGEKKVDQSTQQPAGGTQQPQQPQQPGGGTTEPGQTPGGTEQPKTQ